MSRNQIKTADYAVACTVSVPELPDTTGIAVFDGTVMGSVWPAGSNPTVTCYWWLHGGANPQGLDITTADQTVVATLSDDTSGGRRSWTATFDMSAVPSTTDGYVRVVYVLGAVTRTFHFSNLSWTRPAFLKAEQAKLDKDAAARAALAAVLDPVRILFPKPDQELERLFLVYGKYRAGDDGENTVQVTLHHENGSSVLAYITDTEILPSGSEWAVAVHSAAEAGDRYKLRATLRDKTGKILFRHPVGGLTIHG